MKPSEKFMSNWNCVACGGVGYTYPGEVLCAACINAGNEYRRLRQLERDAELPPVLVIPGAIIPNGRRVVMVQNLDGTQVIDAEWHYNGPKLTMRQANDILEWQEQQEEIATSYRGQ